jgi:hypothetical protein
MIYKMHMIQFVSIVNWIQMKLKKSDWQDEKHEEPRIWTVEGIKIDWSDVLWNAYDSIRVNCEVHSNEIQRSFW